MTLLQCTAPGCTAVVRQPPSIDHREAVERALRHGWTAGAIWRRMSGRGCLCLHRDQRCPRHPHPEGS